MFMQLWSWLMQLKTRQVDECAFWAGEKTKCTWKTNHLFPKQEQWDFQLPKAWKSYAKNQGHPFVIVPCINVRIATYFLFFCDKNGLGYMRKRNTAAMHGIQCTPNDLHHCREKFLEKIPLSLNERMFIHGVQYVDTFLLQLRSFTTSMSRSTNIYFEFKDKNAVN